MTVGDLLTLTVGDLLTLTEERYKALQPPPVERNEKQYVYGLKGLAKLFGCSKTTASRIKQSGEIDEAITQLGHKIIVDAEKAMSLAGIQNGKHKQIQQHANRKARKSA